MNAHDDVYALVGGVIVGPLTFDEWLRCDGGLRDRRERMRTDGVDPWRIARTELDDGTYVSTVFLGHDHNWFGSGDPILFETLIFPACVDMWRCGTYDEALAQHEAVVRERRPHSPAKARRRRP